MPVKSKFLRITTYFYRLLLLCSFHLSPLHTCTLILYPFLQVPQEIHKFCKLVILTEGLGWAKGAPSFEAPNCLPSCQFAYISRSSSSPPHPPQHILPSSNFSTLLPIELQFFSAPEQNLQAPIPNKGNLNDQTPCSLGNTWYDKRFLFLFLFFSVYL